MMMKPISITKVICVMLFTSLISVAQRGKDTATIDKLNRQAWDLKNTELEPAKELALEVLDSAKKINYPRGMSYSYNILGHYYKVKGRYDSAFYFFNKSLIIRQKLHDTIGIASCYRSILNIYKSWGKDQQAIETGLIAVQLLSPKSNNKAAMTELARVQNNLSSMYLKTGDYKTAIKTALDAKRIFTQYNILDGEAAVAMTLGNIYVDLKEYNKALIQFEESIKLNTELDNPEELAKAYLNAGNVYYNTTRYQNALDNYQKSLRIRQKNGYDDDIQGSLYSMGVIYESFGKKDSAFQYYNRSLELSIISGNLEAQYEAHRGLGSVLRELGKYREAIIHLKKSIELSSKTNTLPEKIVQFEEIAKTYNALGNADSAIVYTEKYTMLNDSVNEILRSSIALESSIKDKENELSKKEYALSISKEHNRSQRNIIIAMFLIISLMGIIIFLSLKSSAAKKRMLYLQGLIKEQELLALDAMIEGQETERKRLATELHDTIGSSLAAIKYAFKSVENNAARIMTENQAQYHNINTILDDALNTVRRISHDMASGVLEQGIYDALRQLCDMLQEPGKIHIKLHMYGFDQKIESTVELNLYRIIQELLTNILKHSNAHNVSIQLIKSIGNINLVVEDDGKGFNPGEPNAKHGIGLLNIDKRVKSLAGTWDIDSGKGKGTTTVIDIPVNDINT